MRRLAFVSIPVCALLGTAFWTGLAVAADPAPAPAPVGEIKTLSCDGPFAVDSSEAKLKAAFGEKNVVFKQIDGPEGTTLNASVIFPDDTHRMLTVVWNDEDKREKPAAITALADFSGPEGSDPWKTEILWQTVDGIRIGSDIPALEKANGKPFIIAGFDWDYGGYVLDWQDGKLGKSPNTCVLSIRLQPSSKAPAEAEGDGVQLPSDTTTMRAGKPRVTEISINYPSPDAD